MARTPWAPGAPALADAARVIEGVTRRGQSADAALRSLTRKGSDRRGPDERGPDEAAVRAISLGTLRWYLRLVPAIEALLERPESLSPTVRALLTVAAHQVEYSRNVPQMTVDAAVDAARLLKQLRATGLVNAVLRRFLRERPALFERIDASLAGRSAHPQWMVERFCAAWPSECEQMLAANNAHPPMTLRIDLSRITRADYLERLKEQSIEAYEIQWCPTAITLAHPVDVNWLSGFRDGLVSVQDAGAQLAAPLLNVGKGVRILDACAAPGGKTGHILELAGTGADVTALDVSEDRIALIQENLERLRRTAVLRVGDASDPKTFWDGRPFDRILIDAPCSSTGVIRRHPDVKILRRPGDLTGFVATQSAILRAGMRMLAAGGRLIYSTCSVLPEENEEVVGAVLGTETGAREAPLPADVAPGTLSRSFGVQLLPGTAAGADGFYYACLEKTTTGT